MKIKLIAAAMALVLGLCGCSSDKDTKSYIKDSETAAISADVKKSGSDIGLYMRQPSTFNPLLNEDESVDMVLRLVYEPLIAIDAEFKPSANIAESWYFSNEGKTITLKLKSGLKWHSGEEITSDDVVYSINTIKNAGEKTMYKKCVQYIDSVSAADTYTVNVNFTRAFYGNIYSLMFPLIKSGMGSAQNVYEGTENMKPMGNGSFEFSSYSASKYLTLSKAQSCIGKDALADKINVVISKDSDTDMYYFTDGTTDCIYGSASYFTGQKMPARAAAYAYDTTCYDFIGFNFKNDILQDKNVRKAIAYAVPKKDILDVIYLSNAVLTDSPVNPHSWLYEEDTVKYDYDLGKARELLDNSGWISSETGKARSKNYDGSVKNLKLNILVNIENEQRRQCAKRMADELMSIGFDITVKEAAFGEYTSMVSSGDYDIVIGGWELSYDNDLGVLFGNGGNNIINYNDENMNTYLEAVYSAVGENSVKEAYSDLQKYISDELPYISLVFRTDKIYTGGDVTGGEGALPGWVFSEVYRWYKR